MVEREDRWQHAIDCEKCSPGCAMGYSDLELDLSHIAYWLWIHVPTALLWNRVGFAILPYAGTIAHTCVCRDKNRAVREARWTDPTPARLTQET